MGEAGAKERVLTFISILADTGADCGLIFSENGFQSGAIRAADHTNATLTSLEDFQLHSRRDLDVLRIKVLDGSLLARISQMREALESARYNSWPVVYYPLDDDGTGLIDVMALDGLLYITEETYQTSRRIYDHMLSDEEVVKDWRQFQSPELTELLEAIRTSPH